MNNLFLIVFVSLLLVGISTKGQKKDGDLLVTGNAGGTMKSGNYTVDFTIGEVLVDAFHGKSVMLTQGFHQADIETASTDQEVVVDLGVVSGIDETEFQAEELDVYPNPCKNNLNISYSFDSNQNMVVSVLDITGKEVMNFEGTYDQGTQQLDMSAYPCGIYFLKFFDQENRKLKTFKIIKS